jgi:hypothetical protein
MVCGKVSADPLKVSSLCAAQIEDPKNKPQQPCSKTQRIHLLSANKSGVQSAAKVGSCPFLRKKHMGATEILQMQFV